MSVRTMAKVWADSRHAGSELLMLLAIADFADDEGRAYPAVTTLAEKCRMKPRNANYVLSALRASGELEIRINEGPKGTNLYRIVLERLGLQPVAPPSLQPGAPLQGGAPLQPVASPPAILGIKPLQPSADEPSGTIKEPLVKRSASKSRTSGQTFSEWYEQLEKQPDGRVLPSDDPIREYALSIGITNDFLSVAWHWFRTHHEADDKKTQKDWAATFRNYIRNGWCKCWYRSDKGIWALTTAGKQAAIANGFDPDMTAGGFSQWADAI